MIKIRVLAVGILLIVPLSVFLLLSSPMATLADRTKSPAQPEWRTGFWRGRMVTYEVVNGRNIFEGDIEMDHVAAGPPNPGQPVPYGVGTAYPYNLWPRVSGVYTIPYTITSGSQHTTDAIAKFNATFPGFMQWVPQTSETDYVDFNLDTNDHSGTCFSSVGRVGGKQEIHGSVDCILIIHEMGHAVGLWHEQSRYDRDTFVQILASNIIKSTLPNFNQLRENAQDVGLYDYGSIMQYYAYSFSKNGAPTIETIPPGIVLTYGDGATIPGYSAGDIDTIKRIYGAAPTSVTIDTEPQGLQVMVDGQTITTPQAFNWALNSTHTLSVPTNAQTVKGISYIFGRWNDNGAQTHTITLNPGSGLRADPVTSPAATVYTADFIQLVPYQYSVLPANSGTVTTSPLPQSHSGLSGVYFTARQKITLTANPASSYNFYAWFNSPFWFFGSIHINPKTTYAKDDGTGINVQAAFETTAQPMVTVTTNDPDSNQGVVTDGNFWFTPKNYARDYDGGPNPWTPGSQHTIDFQAPQYPHAYSIRYQFGGWSDGGAQSHTITMPSSGVTTFTATALPQYLLTDYVNQGNCAGTITVSPTSPMGDGFYPGGSIVNFSQTPATMPPGWIFTGWMGDLSGTSNQNLTMNDEALVTADYNTATAPLAVSSLVPGNAVAGGGTFNLTVNGAGFNTNFNNPNQATWLYACVIGNPTHCNYILTGINSSTQLTGSVDKSYIAAPGAFEIGVTGAPHGAACGAWAPKTLFVANGPPEPVPSLSVGKLSFSNQIVGTSSASKPVTLTNSGTATLTSLTIAASGDFTESDNCGTSVAAGKNCVVHVTFTPTVSGAISGEVTIADNGSYSPQLIDLSGTGVTPLTISPTSLSFGTVNVGTSSTKTVTLTNNQSSSLSLAITASGDYTAPASGSTCGAMLAGNKACVLAVRFSPNANGAINGAITISYGPSPSPQVVNVSGTGANGAAGPLTFKPTSVSLKTVPGTSISQPVTVTNSGTSQVTINGLTASGNYTVTGSGATPCQASTVLTNGGACTMTVGFNPTVTGSVNGGVTITDSASISPQVLSLTGTGQLPIGLSSTSLSFAPQAVGTTSAAKAVTLTNNTTSALTPAVTPSGDYGIVSNNCTAPVAAKKTCTFGVTFTPSIPGTINGAVTVSYAGSVYSPQVLKLSGVGQ